MQTQEQLLHASQSFKKRFLIKEDNEWLSIPIDAVAYFISKGRYSELHTYDGAVHVTAFTMDWLETQVDPFLFFRVNRKFLIAFASILKINSTHTRRLLLELQPSCNEEVVVSALRVSEFKKWLDC